MSWSGFNNFLTGNDDKWSLKFKTLYSEVFKKHKKGELKNVELPGDHPRPWRWLRAMIFLFAIGALGLLNVVLLGEYAFPWLTLVAASIIPITIAVFLYESVSHDKFRLIDVLIVFLIGATVSFFITGLLNLGIKINDVRIRIVFIAPPTEEIAKFLVIAATIKFMRIKRVSSAIFIGWIIGSGFQVIETMGYSIVFGIFGANPQAIVVPGGTFLIWDGTIDYSIMFLRLLFSFTSHGFWGAIHGLAFVVSTKDQSKRFSILRLTVWFLFCVISHMAWNAIATYFPNLTGLRSILLILIQAIHIPVFFYLLDAGLRDHKEFISSIKIEEPTSEELAPEDVAEPTAQQ